MVVDSSNWLVWSLFVVVVCWRGNKVFGLLGWLRHRSVVIDGASPKKGVCFEEERAKGTVFK